MSFFTAYDLVSPLFASSGVLALVAGAERSGLLQLLTEPTSLPAVAAHTSIPEPRAEALCHALVTHAVVVRTGSCYELAPAWKALTSPAAFAPLADVLAGLQVEARAYRALGEGDDYWSMPAEDRLTFARAISPNPFSAALVEGFRAASQADPDSAALAEGGDYLELGCGVAGRILVNLQAFPRLRAVGVELAGDLVEVARDRAEQLGLTDRFEVVHEDARGFDRPGCFDFAFWSQFFFPESARVDALATLFRSLRPGGIAWAPCAADFDELEAHPDGPEAKVHALRRLLLLSWGVPERSAAELAEEFTAAGFVDLSTSGGGGKGPVRVRAVRP